MPPIARPTTRREASAAPVRIALAGAGLIGRVHAQAVAAEPTAALVAVVDPAETGARLAARHRAAHHRSLDELFAAGRPDAVILATPNAGLARRRDREPSSGRGDSARDARRRHRRDLSECRIGARGATQGFVQRPFAFADFAAACTTFTISTPSAADGNRSVARESPFMAACRSR